jgi:hypothetical protein
MTTFPHMTIGRRSTKWISCYIHKRRNQDRPWRPFIASHWACIRKRCVDITPVSFDIAIWTFHGKGPPVYLNVSAQSYIAEMASWLTVTRLQAKPYDHPISHQILVAHSFDPALLNHSLVVHINSVYPKYSRLVVLSKILQPSGQNYIKRILTIASNNQLIVL